MFPIIRPLKSSRSHCSHWKPNPVFGKLPDTTDQKSQTQPGKTTAEAGQRHTAEMVSEINLKNQCQIGNGDQQGGKLKNQSSGQITEGGKQPGNRRDIASGTQI